MSSGSAGRMGVEMNNSIYMACFRGQWGWLFSSMGVDMTARRAEREINTLKADVFGYTQLDRAAHNIAYYRYYGRKIVLLGYSAGVGSITSLQQNISVDLLLGIAGSKWCLNYPIDHTHTKRSVLWRDKDEPTSAAGADLGFDVIHEIDGVTHLTMDFHPDVWKGVIDELWKLARS